MHFSICKVAPGPDQPMHMPKLACVKKLAFFHLVYIQFLYQLMINPVVKLFSMNFLMSLSHPQG